MKAEINHQIELDQQEYEERIFFWITNFKSGYWVNDPNSKFHPKYFKGTQQEYDKVTEMYFNNENGKIIGSHKYNSLEDLLSRETISGSKVTKSVNLDRDKAKREENYRYLKSSYR